MKSGPNHHNGKHSASGNLHLSWLSIPLFLALIGFFWMAELKVVLEPPYLLPLLNFIFSTAVSIFVAYLAVISFARNASVTVLMLGSGMLFFGMVSLIAAIAIQLDRINVGITVYNTGVLFTGICHLLAATALVIESRVNRNAVLILNATYALVLTVTGLLTYAAVKDLTPVFFIQGIGPTPLRQAVLGTAVGVHVVSGIIIALVSRRFHWRFGQWYALSLWMIAIGLFGVLIISHVGSPLGWSGRAAQYLGGIYMLVALLAAAREGGEWDAALQSALKESQERYRILAEATFEGIMISEEGIIVDANEQFCRMLGYSGGELIGKRVADLIPEKDRELVVSGILSGGDRAGEHAMLKKDGTLIVVEAHGRTALRNGRPMRLSAVRDITDRKKSEEALQESEDKFSKAFHSSATFLFITERDTGIFIEINSAYAVLTGYKREELIGHSSIDLGILTRDSRSDILRHLTETGRVQNMQAQIVTKSGEIKTCLFSAEQLEYRNKRCLICSGIDITERLHAEEVIKESERKFRLLFENIPDGVLLTVPDGTITAANPAACKMLGRSEKEICAMGRSEIFDVSDSRFAIALQEQKETGRIREYELTAIRKSGEKFPVAIDATIMPGAPLRSFVVIRDITERKRAEETLRESEEKFRTVFEQAAVGIGQVSFDDARFIEVNDTFCRMLGYNREEFLSTPWPQITHPEDVDLDLIPFRRMAAGELDSYTVEKRFIHKQGHHVWARLTLSLVRDSKGLPHYEIAVIENISDKKKAEDALRENSALLDAVLETLPAGVLITDENGRIIRDNAATRKLWGLPPETKSWEDYGDWVGWWPETGERIKAHEWAMTRALQQGDVTKNELIQNQRFNSQERRYYLNNVAPLRNDDGRIIGGVAAMLDVTDRLAAEQALKAANELNRSILESITDGFLALDKEWRYTYFNETGARMIGMRRQDLIGGCVWELFPHAASTKFFTEYHRAVDTGTPVHFEEYYSDPLNLWLECHCYPTQDGLTVFFRDISERKRAEEALRESQERIQASLAEKKVLLKEIHHRVKNNMQVISSLVALQADELQDDTMRNVLKDVTDRVRSMAMVHEKLYQSADLARIDFADYTESLLHYLWRSYGTAASGVRLNLDLSPVLLPVNAAVPSGLILNELLSNALKHAFRGRDGGQISVSLHEDEQNRLRLCVQDNGIGLPPGMDWQQSRSLGLRLVRTLARQLHASIDVASAEGTEFTIMFERRPHA